MLLVSYYASSNINNTKIWCIIPFKASSSENVKSCMCQYERQYKNLTAVLVIMIYIVLGIGEVNNYQDKWTGIFEFFSNERHSSRPNNINTGALMTFTCTMQSISLFCQSEFRVRFG